MCGRYTIHSYFGDLWTRFGLVREDIDYRPLYNVAPTQRVLAVIDDGSEDGPHGEMLRWGFIPFYTKDLKKSPLMINARAETVAKSGAFRSPFRHQRCLVLANGFYEWRKEGKDKIPMFMSLESGDPFAFAALWSDWISSPSGKIQSCTIITTTPNSVMQPIHDRMSVILPQKAEALWLDRATDEPEVLQSLFVPYAGEMTAFEVSSTVNSMKNDAPDLVLPA